jgi:dephospho-CoA kinase
MRRVRDLHPYVGRTLEAKIIELDKNRNNVVLSRRAWLEETQSATRRAFLHTLRKGEVRKGVVSSIVNFGAFVDLGGVDGLVHVSELSWKHIDHPSEVVEVGQEVEVEVLDVDLERERVSLSLKATQEDPWRQFARSHQIGELIPGRVTKLVPFGAFVRVDDGIEGLVHISELAERHVDIPEQVVSVGEEITVKVIDIDLDRRRISLSLKQAAQDQAQLTAPEDELALEEGAYQYAEGEYAEGAYVEGAYAEGDYADGSYVYDEQGNPIGVMPGTAMAEAFQEAGFYEGGYDAEGQPTDGQPAEGQATEAQPAEAQPGARGRAGPGGRRRPGAKRRHAREHRRGPEAQERRRVVGPHGPPPGGTVGRSARELSRGGGGMLLVGLTGGIASGKSTVSAMLAERGAEIIDADHIARQIVLPGLPAWCKIREHFGPGVLHPDGQIDRQALADLVFADKAKLALLNEITHPAIFARIADRLEEYHDQDVVVVLDAALLIEAGLAEGVDVVIVTHSPTEIQVERLAAKGVGERDASNRIAAQLEPEKRLARADIVIDNSGSVEKLGRRVDEVWEQLQRQLAQRTRTTGGEGNS